MKYSILAIVLSTLLLVAACATHTDNKDTHEEDDMHHEDHEHEHDEEHEHNLEEKLANIQVTPNKDLNILVSILPQKEFVTKVAGDTVNVKALIPPGASPATYELSPQDVIAIEEADIYFRIGHIPFEKAHMEKIEEINPELAIVDTSKDVILREFAEHEAHTHHEDEHSHEEEAHDEHDEEHEHEEESHHQDHDHTGIDPHIWLSPEQVKTQVETITDTFITIDPTHDVLYNTNKDAYIAELTAAQENIKTTLEQADVETIMVFHPAWGYFTSEFGLEQIAIEREGKEPTAKELEEFVTIATEENINVIFVQEQFNKAVANSIAEEVDATIVSIDPLAENYTENIQTVAKIIAGNNNTNE